MVKPIILITMGDPAGSSPEITLKALSNPEVQGIAKYVVIGDLRVLMKAREIVGARKLNLTVVNSPEEVGDELFNVGVIDLSNVDVEKLVYGRPSAVGGKASYEYIVTAVDLIRSGRGHALVTAPISKESLYLAGYNYPGHTELLAELAGVEVVKMMLVFKHLRVTHVTTHVPLRKAIELVRKNNVYVTIRLTHEALTKLFGIESPRIGVAGLNPHASEGGLFGDEEEKEVRPAIELALREGIRVEGPYPPDTIFYRAYHDKEFDAVIAMYHDQGHIPVKMVGLLEGVNLTLGLPFIRTSPDHGTVWDKAGKGTAKETAMLEAIKLAVTLASKQLQ
jgi:4-hydroxythreonine-4-phosphate dehydrogenase